MTPILKIEDLTRRFGGLVAVNNVTMSLRAGEIRGVIGPNGAGKTTLLSLIGGQIRPTAGSVIFAGMDITRTRPDQRAARGIRRTFQNLKLFPEMTVLENAMIGFHTESRAEIIEALLRTPSQRREERQIADEAYRALARVGLSDMALKTAGSLAYGHRRMLEVARAIVARPHILLLDEPCAGFNPSEAVEFVRLIRQLQTDGVTILLVEHHMDVVMTACQTITVLNYGEMLAEGTADQVRDNPDVRAAYLGNPDLYQQVAHA
jgi:branched-chain amino acid transport system ATP-binding protein